MWQGRGNGWFPPYWALRLDLGQDIPEPDEYSQRMIRSRDTLSPASRAAGPLPRLMLALALLFQSLMYASVVDCHEAGDAGPDMAMAAGEGMAQHGGHGALEAETAHDAAQMADDHDCHCPPAGCMLCAGNDCGPCPSAGTIGSIAYSSGLASDLQSVALPLSSHAAGFSDRFNWHRPPGRAPPFSA
jgi:hypothetical protein